MGKSRGRAIQGPKKWQGGVTRRDGVLTDEVMIRVHGLGKRFKIYRQPWARLGEWASRGRYRPFTEFWAVRNVSFTLRRGRCMGVLGPNGAGKSTLLKVLSGALYPTEGDYEIRGRVLSLIELGTGVNPQMTGRQNVENAAKLLNFPPGFARRKMGEIEEFAEVGEFFDRPVRLYSSGMRARLAFSMFACFRPKLFIVDEVLSVGDVFFKQKCAERLKGMLADGMSMLFVSHDTSAVMNLCDEALVLWKGQPMFLGDPEEAVSRYYARLSGAGRAAAEIHQNEPASADVHHNSPPAAEGTPADGPVRTDASEVRRTSIFPPSYEHRHGEGGGRIEAVRVLNDEGRDALRVPLGGRLHFQMLLQADRAITVPRVGIHIYNRFNDLVFASGSSQLGIELPALERGRPALVRVSVRFNLSPGEYTFSLGLGQGFGGRASDGVVIERVTKLGPIRVLRDKERDPPFYGVASLPMEVAPETGDPS